MNHVRLLCALALIAFLFQVASASECIQKGERTITGGCSESSTFIRLPAKAFKLTISSSDDKAPSQVDINLSFGGCSVTVKGYPGYNSTPEFKVENHVSGTWVAIEGSEDKLSFKGNYTMSPNEDQSCGSMFTVDGDKFVVDFKASFTSTADNVRLTFDASAELIDANELKKASILKIVLLVAIPLTGLVISFCAGGIGYLVWLKFCKKGDKSTEADDIKVEEGLSSKAAKKISEKAAEENPPIAADSKPLADKVQKAPVDVKPAPVNVSKPKPVDKPTYASKPVNDDELDFEHGVTKPKGKQILKKWHRVVKKKWGKKPKQALFEDKTQETEEGLVTADDSPPKGMLSIKKTVDEQEAPTHKSLAKEAPTQEEDPFGQDKVK